MRINFTQFELESMMPELCAAGINVMFGDNDSDLPQIIELERQAWPFEGRWCEMWATACEFTGHCNQREDGQHILAGENALQAYVGDTFQQGTLKGDTGYAHLYSDPKGDSIYADSVGIPIVLNMGGIVTILPADGALPLCSAHDVDFWIEPRAKKINVTLACPAWSVRTIKDASKSTMTVSTWVENFTWKHQRFDPRGELSLKLNIYQLKLNKNADLGPLMPAGHVELTRPHISQAAKCVKPRMG